MWLFLGGLVVGTVTTVIALFWSICNGLEKKSKEYDMRIILTILFILAATVVNAQTVTTTTVNTTGIVNCQLVNLTVSRVQNEEVKTYVQFSIKECGYGETSPSVTKAYFNSPIPNQDFTIDKQGAHLTTDSPYGKMDVVWTITKDSRSTYDATWTWTAPNNRRETQNDEFLSVHAIGTIGNTPIDRNGYFITSISRK